MYINLYLTWLIIITEDYEDLKNQNQLVCYAAIWFLVKTQAISK